MHTNCCFVCRTCMCIVHVCDENCAPRFTYRKRCTYIDNLKSGHALLTKSVLYTYSTGNSLGSIHFIWRIPEDVSEKDLLSGNSEAMRKIQPTLPTYHTRRAMRREFFNQISLFRFGKPAALRGLYWCLTGELVHVLDVVRSPC